MTALCVKCKKVESTIDIKFAIYCSPCFQEATYHKYRIMLARSRESTQGQESRTAILLPRNFMKSTQIFRASRVLIHLTQLPGIQEPARKNLVTYDLVVPFESDTDRLEEFLNEIIKVYPNLGQVYIINGESDAIEYEKWLLTKNTEQPKLSFDVSLLSNTLKEDLFNAKLLHSQLKLMNFLGIERALTPETSTALASYILTCTCKGRGKFLPWDSALTRSFPDGKFLARPLKDISDKEIELYCQEVGFNEPLKSETNTNINTSTLSIDQLTVNFLTNLETENPGTANVVIRTSSKVTTNNENSESDSRCKICLAPNGNEICNSCEPLSEFFI